MDVSVVGSVPPNPFKRAILLSATLLAEVFGILIENTSQKALTTPDGRNRQ